MDAEYNARLCDHGRSCRHVQRVCMMPAIQSLCPPHEVEAVESSCEINEHDQQAVLNAPNARTNPGVADKSIIAEHLRTRPKLEGNLLNCTFRHSQLLRGHPHVLLTIVNLVTAATMLITLSCSLRFVCESFIFSVVAAMQIFLVTLPCSASAAGETLAACRRPSIGNGCSG